MERRNVLKGAGAVAAAVATGGWTTVGAKAGAEARRPRGMARGLTVLNIRRNGEDTLGVKTEKGILDAQEAARLLHMHTPADIDDLLQHEDGPSLNALVAAAMKSSSTRAAFIKEDGIEYGPIVTHPEKIVCVGLNYRRHAQEVGQAIPKEPVLFSKFNTTLNRHNGTIKLPVHVAKKFDYEVELVIVIGKEAHNVAEADALSFVAGYCTGNDFTARDLQYEIGGGQWLIGKTPDQFAPIGWPLHGHGRPDRSRQSEAGVPRQWRDPPVLEHQRHDRQYPAHDQLYFPPHHATPGRYYLHRHAGRRDPGQAQRPAGLAESG
jgi:2-keto-4-pentenoate hydratase/2-oxohepta-3-ene-1,7-dioic acid hydratase in catechol pathway